jgi:cytochrome c oxidase subunit I
VIFVVNMWQTLRGAEPRAARQKGDQQKGDGALVAVESAITMIAVGLALGAGAAGFFLGRSTAGSQTKTVTVKTGGGRATPSATAAGKQVFASAGCGGCHTLTAAGSTGTVGPNLDQAKPPTALVVQRVTNGKGGMPPFKGQLSGAQIQAVARYVSVVAGK